MKYILPLLVLIAFQVVRPVLPCHGTGSGLRNSPLGAALSRMVYFRSQTFFHHGESEQDHAEHEVSYPTPRDWLYRQTLSPEGIAHAKSKAAALQADLSRLTATIALMRCAQWLDPRHGRASLDAAFLAREFHKDPDGAAIIMDSLKHHVRLISLDEQTEFWVLYGLWSHQDHNSKRLEEAQVALHEIDPSKITSGLRITRQDVLSLGR